MVESTTGAADHGDRAGVSGQRGVEGELEVGGVLVSRVGFDGRPRGACRREGIETHRIEVPDDQVDVAAERGGVLEARNRRR